MPSLRSQRHRRAFGTVASLFSVLFLAACAERDEEQATAETQSNDAESNFAAPTVANQAAPAGLDPCTVLAADEVRAVTNIAASGEPSVSGGAQVCTWSDASGKAAVVQIGPGAGRFEESRLSFLALYGEQPEDLAGLGDAAYHIVGATGAMTTSTIGALKGQMSVIVQVMESDAEQAVLKQEATALTETLLPKI